jgi:hypothetical protein
MIQNGASPFSEPEIVYARKTDLEELARLRKERERLRELLAHADKVVIWEHTPARSGFQEEIEEVLGISTLEQGVRS